MWLGLQDSIVCRQCTASQHRGNFQWDGVWYLDHIFCVFYGDELLIVVLDVLFLEDNYVVAGHDVTVGDCVADIINFSGYFRAWKSRSEVTLADVAFCVAYTGIAHLKGKYKTISYAQ